MTSISDVFHNLSLMVAKSLIESFSEEACVQRAMCYYLRIGRNFEARPPERWGKFNMMVEHMRKKAVIDVGKDNGEED